MSNSPFHLSLITRDLEATRDFYCGGLAATIGRENHDWIDILLLGHQLTFHARADALRPGDGMQHFGLILDSVQ